MRRMRIVSVGLAVISFAALSGVNVLIFRGMNERNGLQSRNDVERTFTMLFTSLRGYSDFGAAIEGDPLLKGRVLGFGLYGAEGTNL
jgi:hypothetical protein